MKKVLKITGKILVAFLLILPMVLIVYVMAEKISGKTPMLLGYNTSIVVSPSMTDILPVGTIILNREYHIGDDLSEGDIITYTGQSGSSLGKSITHQIIDIYEENGQTVVITKGTNNNVSDDPIGLEDIQSKYVCTIIKLGKVYTALKNPVGFMLILVLPIVFIIIFEVWNFVREIKKAKESEDSDETTEDSES